MRLALVLRRGWRLPMQLDPTKSPSLGSAAGSSSTSTLKRSYAQSAHAYASSSRRSPSSFSASDNDYSRPGKVPKIEETRSALSPTSHMSQSGHSRTHHPTAPSSLSSRLHPPGPSPANRRRGGKGKGRSGHALPVLPGHVHDLTYITHTFKTKPLRWRDEQPKSHLVNFLKSQLGKSLHIDYEEGTSSLGQPICRATIRVEDDGIDITAIGDDAYKKEAEKLAMLSALYQLDALGAFDKSWKKQKQVKDTETSLSPAQVTLSDGSVVDFERARQFMDYYCRRFGFGKPDITYGTTNGRGVRGITNWQADMTVGGRRIGFGKGTTKKASMTACYVDVTQYLEECDPAIWKQFVEDAKTGKDIGLAPRVLFQVHDALEDQIHDLCQDIKASSLYKNRPKIGPHKTGDDAPDGVSTLPSVPQPILYRRPVPTTYLEEKSERLREQRKQYLQNPNLEHIRNIRAALPVYTKAEALLEHIRTHDVTICMATTGSGKTTQIPQLVLDEWIEKGEGAKCNIVCTQPRRIAAISVAERVAKERGEKAGRGSTVGYQVRFEANLPDEYGSITFCTTGIFLKRMQSAMLGESRIGRDLEDVTHVVVDEVHERDVDTDLLLVVLKRLLADRKARNKPLKVVLMSATIDPTLFQEYFPDEMGTPASITEVPGRAFPVQKNFLDDFVPQLFDNQSHRWVFENESVQKYLAHQMGPAAPQLPGPRKFRLPETPNLVEGVQDDDLDMPTPLIALTIAHVLNNSNDGHVLVFLPGWDEISNVQKCLLDPRPLYGLNFNDTSKFNIHVLHSTVPIADQQVIFEPPPAGVRRIILATNIAETSVTIPDVVYVVDTAKVKEQRYDPERHISSLVSAWVGSSNLNQRAGRAGRHRPGEYYGILTRKFADELHPHQTVEMKRVDLSNVVMHIKALNFPGMTVEEVLEETIEPPAPDRVEAAMKSLQMVGALDSHKNLTSLGRVLLQLPVDVQMGRLVLYGCFFRCLDQALTLAAILTNRDPFLAPIHLKQAAAAKKNSWSPEEFRSDALATLRAYNAWWDIQKRGHYVSANRFCMDNFLSKPTLTMIQKIKEHLLQSVYQAGVIDVSAGGSVMSRPSRGQGYAVPPELDHNGESMPLLAALISIALQPKYAIRISERTYRTAVDKTVFIHPSSVNHRKREALEPDGNTVFVDRQLVAYAEKRQNMSTGSSNPQKFLVTTTRLDPLAYILFGAYEIDVVARGLECDGWLPIAGRQDALDDVERLKTLMESCLLRVFEGIAAGKTQRGRRSIPECRDDREDESGDEDTEKVFSLSDMEIKELDLMTRDIVRILDRYNEYRIANQSRHNSRPATPMGSPSSVSGRLPPLSGARSGYSTPYNMGSAYNTRPSTPSQLSRRY